MVAPKSALPPPIKTFTADSASRLSNKERPSVVSELEFVQLVRLERRRSERSGKPFMLILVRSEDFGLPAVSGVLVGDLVASITACTRETDVTGWYEQDLT